MKRKSANTMSVAAAPRIAAYQNPMPTRMPIAAVIQIDAAVVKPRTVRPSLKITPAPRNPMPVMMPCAIRVGAAVERTLKTDHGADDKGACQSADDDEFIMTHDGILSTCKAYCPN